MSFCGNMGVEQIPKYLVSLVSTHDLLITSPAPNTTELSLLNTTNKGEEWTALNWQKAES